MLCFLRACTPSRLSFCTGVYLLFLGKGIWRLWACAAGNEVNIEANISSAGNTRRCIFVFVLLAVNSEWAVALLLVWMSFRLIRLGCAQRHDECFLSPACHLSCCWLHPTAFGERCLQRPHLKE